MDPHHSAFAPVWPDPQVTELGWWRDFGSKKGDKGKMCLVMMRVRGSVSSCCLVLRHWPALLSAHVSPAFKEKSKNQTRDQYIQCRLDCVMAQRDGDKKCVLEIRK